MQNSTFGKLHEHSFNTSLAHMLTQFNASWRNEQRPIVLSERTGLLSGNQRSDILILDPKQRPVAIEVDLSSKKDAEKDALARLGISVKGMDAKLNVAIAVVAPGGAEKWMNNEIEDKLSTTNTLSYAAYFNTNPIEDLTPSPYPPPPPTVAVGGMDSRVCCRLGKFGFGPQHSAGNTGGSC